MVMGSTSIYSDSPSMLPRTPLAPGKLFKLLTKIFTGDRTRLTQKGYSIMFSNSVLDYQATKIDW